MKHLLFIAIIVLAMGCDDCCHELENGQDLVGKWRVVEVGYSPGAGYITDNVEDQSSFIQFGTDHHFQSNYEELNDVHYYRITEGNGNPVLELYPSKPTDDMSEQLVYKYHLSFEDNLLKLKYVYCIEGCHIGIQKVE